MKRITINTGDKSYPIDQQGEDDVLTLHVTPGDSINEAQLPDVVVNLSNITSVTVEEV